MRTFTLLFLFLFTTVAGFSQVFIVESPEDVAGLYLMEIGGFGDDLADTLICGQLVYAEPNEACTDITNDVMGKIALIDRGTCEFGAKALNAQNMGAIAVVVVNNQPGGTIVMGAGAVGNQVTIPAIMISLEDGDIIKTAFDDGVIEVCMGDVVFDNDLRASISDVTAPYTATIPITQITEENDVSSFLPEARVTNVGTNPVSNVTVDLSIDFTPQGSTTSTNEFSEQVVMDDLLEPDSVAFAEFSTFDFSESGLGIYTLNYSFATDSIEEQLADNDVTSEFFITENVYCKGGWNLEEDRPFAPLAFTTQDGGSIEFLTGFHVPNGDGLIIDSIKAYVSINADDAPTLEDVSLIGKIYTWVDEDEDGTAINEEVNLVASGTFTFDENAENAGFASIPIKDELLLSDGYLLADDTKFFVGVRYEGEAQVFFGFDNTKSFSFAQDAGYTDPTDTNLPYFFFDGELINNAPDFGSLSIFGNSQDHFACGVYINEFIDLSTNTLTDEEAKVELFPNPASTVMTTNVSLDEVTSKLEYNIYDMQGRIIFSVVKNDVKEDINEFNIEQLPAGVYNLNITTDKGIKAERFSVQR